MLPSIDKAIPVNIPVRTKIISFFTTKNTADFLPVQAEGRNRIKIRVIRIADKPYMFILRGGVPAISGFRYRKILSFPWSPTRSISCIKTRPPLGPSEFFNAGFQPVHDSIRSPCPETCLRIFHWRKEGSWEK
ncbi:hypothetical protein PVA48_05970 [Akkermansia sp. JRP_AM1]|uniref:hypothetical protein n=1 Tax=Akkermansia sp. JRP_AM1 TaxID=3414159 RepID=UPI003BFA6995